MEERLRSVRTVGVAMAVLSGLILMSNVAGLVIVQALPVDVNGGASRDVEEGYALLVPVLGIVLSLGLLVAGIFLARYKNWAGLLAQTVSVLYLLYIWGQATLLSSETPVKEGDQTLDRIIMAFIWSIPFLLLLKFLTMKDVKRSME